MIIPFLSVIQTRMGILTNRRHVRITQKSKCSFIKERKMRKNVLILGLLVILLSSAGQPALAESRPGAVPLPVSMPNFQDSGVEIIDQKQEGIGYGYILYSGNPRWQEFIPTVYNITAVDVYIIKVGSPGKLVVEVQELGGTVLGHAEFDAVDLPPMDWLHVEFTQFSVTPGTRYRIVLKLDTVSSPGDTADYYDWRGDPNSLYCATCDSSLSASDPGYHFSFRTYGVGIYRPTRADFDGNRSTDVSVYRPSNGKWYAMGQTPVAWGMPGDIPVPGTYFAGCGMTASHEAVYRPSNGNWYFYDSVPVSWGHSGDIPVPADYNGDGETDIAVLRPSNGKWYIRGMGNYSWHNTGDIPVPCDYNGDFTDDIAVFRPSNGNWYIRHQSPVSWGMPDDIPVPADYDGDGACEIAVYRPSNGKWYIMGQAPVKWGFTGDIPVPGDYDGCGDADIAVLRPSNGRWYIQGMGNHKWFRTGDYPLPARDTNADGDPHE